MLELVITVLFCWLFFTVFKLMFKIAWGANCSIAVNFCGSNIDWCLLLASGLILLLPIAMLVVAFLLINN